MARCSMVVPGILLVHVSFSAFETAPRSPVRSTSNTRKVLTESSIDTLCSCIPDGATLSAVGKEVVDSLGSTIGARLPPSTGLTLVLELEVAPGTRRLFEVVRVIGDPLSEPLSPFAERSPRSKERAMALLDRLWEGLSDILAELWRGGRMNWIVEMRDHGCTWML
jgi:hypothetical protein